MNFGESELIYERYDVRLLKIGCRKNCISYCVIGNGPTRHYEDYDDALEEYNRRWLEIYFNEQKDFIE